MHMACSSICKNDYYMWTGNCPENTLKMLMYCFPVIIIYCFHNEKNTNKGYILENNWNFFFLGGCLCGLHMDVLKNMMITAYNHFYVPALFYVLYKDYLI